MTDDRKRVFDAVVSLMEPYAELVQRGLDQRWEQLLPKIELYDSETYEVPIGLAARQATLTMHLALNPGIWTGHIAPLILRAMTDAHITLAWVLKNPHERSRMYILHGLGQEKLNLAHLEADGEEAGNLKGPLTKLIDARKSWLRSQRHDFLTEVNLGSWSGLNVRDMAQESDCDSLYRFAYTPFSAVVHSMWNHVSIYNLRHCGNPLHKLHRVPVIPAVPLDPDFVYRSAKYVSRSYASLDEAFALTVSEPSPVEWLGKELTGIFGSTESSTTSSTDVD